MEYLQLLLPIVFVSKPGSTAVRRNVGNIDQKWPKMIKIQAR